MPPDVQKYLYDIFKACERLLRYSAGKSFSDYLVEDLLKPAIEREFILIGEALMQLLQLEPALDSSITDMKSIIAFRNILVHGYSKISDNDVWRILQNNVPVLKKEVEALMGPAASPPATP